MSKLPKYRAVLGNAGTIEFKNGRWYAIAEDALGCVVGRFTTKRKKIAKRTLRQYFGVAGAVRKVTA